MEQSRFSAEHLGEKIGYAIGLTIFSSLLYFVALRHLLRLTYLGTVVIVLAIYILACLVWWKR